VTLVEVGSTSSGLADPTDIVISGNFAYVSDLDNGLVIFNITDPSSPFEVSSIKSELTAATSVAVSNNVLM
jgi:hypothetical protein